ncbi:MAG: hypothetical protein WCG23_01955 [bacterium]
MKLNKILLILLIMLFITQIFSKSVTAKTPDYKSRLEKEHLVLTKALSELCSETTKPCDKIELKVLEDINCGNRTIIPCDSIIEGKVVKVKNSFFLRSDAYIDFLITNIKMSSGCNICLEKEPIKLRIVDPNYKNIVRRVLQRAPVFVGGLATSISLGAASPLSNGVIAAVSIGASALGGFVSGFVDPDIDKTRIDGAITRGVEGTPLGSFLLTVENGCSINSFNFCYVTIKFDEKARQKVFCSMQRAIAASNNF